MSRLLRSLANNIIIPMCIVVADDDVVFNFIVLQLDQPEPDAEVAIVIGQDTLGSAQIQYSAAAQVSVVHAVIGTLSAHCV